MRANCEGHGLARAKAIAKTTYPQEPEPSHRENHISAKSQSQANRESNRFARFAKSQSHPEKPQIRKSQIARATSIEQVDRDTGKRDRAKKGQIDRTLQQSLVTWGSKLVTAFPDTSNRDDWLGGSSPSCQALIFELETWCFKEMTTYHVQFCSVPK